MKIELWANKSEVFKRLNLDGIFMARRNYFLVRIQWTEFWLWKKIMLNYFWPTRPLLKRWLLFSHMVSVRPSEKQKRPTTLNLVNKYALQRTICVKIMKIYWLWHSWVTEFARIFSLLYLAIRVRSTTARPSCP